MFSSFSPLLFLAVRNRVSSNHDGLKTVTRVDWKKIQNRTDYTGVQQMTSGPEVVNNIKVGQNGSIHEKRASRKKMKVPSVVTMMKVQKK